ncbi:MAG TPA: acylphosphatase [Acidimicrobiales bacterium]|nr:acylphosphatase [Acidimicrobiales bacterium]
MTGDASPSDEVIRVRAVVSGLVQGVWYRQSCRREAERLGVSGWVRNRPDGRVELEAEGTRGAVDALLAWAHDGPPQAVVESVDVEPVAQGPGEVGFMAR